MSCLALVPSAVMRVLGVWWYVGTRKVTSDCPSEGHQVPACLILATTWCCTCSFQGRKLSLEGGKVIAQGHSAEGGCVEMWLLSLQEGGAL